mmetsp:Transcript_41351/g.58195  ORF Transcript_41351/g.58195 Transcript_41351/m.58195 type:complete len:171 (-) Transcript_41351:35-547(-)
MGGGLSFYVSEKANLDYIGCLAPVVGVDNFAPTTAMEGGGPKNALLVAGGCDIIARPKSVESIYNDCRSKGTKAIYAVIEQATHTGFEDELDIIVPTALSNLLDLFNISKITQSIVSTARRLATKDEIVLSRLLMSYVFSSMLSRKSLSMDEAEKFISNNSDMSGRLIMK